MRACCNNQCDPPGGVWYLYRFDGSKAVKVFCSEQYEKTAFLTRSFCYLLPWSHIPLVVASLRTEAEHHRTRVATCRSSIIFVLRRDLPSIVLEYMTRSRFMRSFEHEYAVVEAIVHLLSATLEVATCLKVLEASSSDQRIACLRPDLFPKAMQAATL